MTTLIVDDDSIIVFMHKKIMAGRKGIESILSFADGLEAYSYLEENYSEKEDYLILLDINMPRLNGWDFLDKIQNESFSDNFKVVMVSSSIDPMDRDRSKIYPQVIGYIPKPLDSEKGQKIISLALGD